MAHWNERQTNDEVDAVWKRSTYLCMYMYI
jgi:hypothetical protein